MQQRHGYIQNRPPAISPTATIQHVGVRSVNATVAPRPAIQPVAQFKARPPQLRQYDDGVNLYQYCGSDPINYVDPWGLSKKATICIRPLNSWPYTWALVHCFIKAESGNWNFGKDDGFATEPAPGGVGGKKPKCVTVTCKCDIDKAIRDTKWGKDKYRFVKNNCCHWVDNVLKKAGCKGVEGLFPGYSLPKQKFPE